MKKTLQLKVKKPEVESLKTLSRMLKKTQRLNFARRYGKIIDLLDVNVQLESITAVTQFYDPPLRCFTFRDFQLAPTLEEFEQILGHSLKEDKPYRYLGHYPSLQTIAGVLKVHTKDLEAKAQTRNQTRGFPMKYLEEQMHRLARVEDWDAFMDVLALTIYGIILFPNIDEFVDLGAIDVFMARKFKGENPVPAVLADVYYTLNFCHERKGKRILCCLPVLYVWLTAHVFDRKSKGMCPFTDLNMLCLKVKSSKDWAQILANLTEKTVRWYPQWEEIQDVICQCGDFPNVPLMGTKGCINYNPTLALRQLGYPMMGPPAEDEIIPFVLYTMDTEHTETIRKVHRAWDKVFRKGKELGARSCGARDSYRRWVKDRALEVKLPFQIVSPQVEETPMPIPMDTEEMEEMKTKLAQTEEEKKELKAKLNEICQAYEALQLGNTEKEHSLEKANKRARTEQEYMLKTKDCLRAANKELGLRRQERDKAMVENQHLKELLANSKMTQRDVQKQLDKVRHQVEVMVVECGDKIKRKDQHTEEMVMRCQNIINEKCEEIQGLIGQMEEKDRVINGEKCEVKFWMTRFSKLVRLANGAIEEVPRLLRSAEGMVNPLSTPREITDFIEHCKELIEQMHQLIACNN